MANARLLWLLVPGLGLAELALHFYFAERAPSVHAWSELRPEVEKLRQPGELVVISPEWAEPLARQALGQELMPLADVARVDASGYARAVEISLLGQHASELAGFRVLDEQRLASGFTLRRLQNPRFEAVRFAFLDHVQPGQLFVVEWNGEAEHTCPFSDRARSSAGGLGGHVTYPRERFRCTGGEPFFVGVTIIDDQRYRPRRCLYAHPLINAALHLRFPNVPAGNKLRGYAGLSYLLARDGLGTPVEFAAFIDGREIGRRAFKDEEGFSPFEFKFDPAGRERVEVTFQIQSPNAKAREFCFQAEMR